MSPNELTLGHFSIEDIFDFWDRVNMLKMEPEKCWEWMGGKTRGGYGQYKKNNRIYRAHRVAYLTANGEFDTRLRVLHKCDNPGCCNPDHLFLGTPKDNVIDRKLSKANVAKIKGALNRGETTVSLGKKYGVTHQTISAIKHGKIWADN